MNKPTYKAIVTVEVPVEVTAEQATRLNRVSNRLYDVYDEKADPDAPLVPVLDICVPPYRVIPKISIEKHQAQNSINQEPVTMLSGAVADTIARQIQQAVTDAVRASIKMELQK